MKKILSVLFVIIMVTSAVVAGDFKIAGVSNEWASRYIYRSLDYIPQNHAVNTLGLNVFSGKTSLFPYVAFNTNAKYWELGMSLDFVQPLWKDGIVVKASAMPFTWWSNDAKVDYGATFSVEAQYKGFALTYSRSVVPKHHDWEGDLLIAGYSDSLFGFDFKLEAGYNWGFWIPASGWNGLASVSKTFTTGHLSVTPFFRYYWAQQRLNEDEPTFGLILGWAF